MTFYEYIDFDTGEITLEPAVDLTHKNVEKKNMQSSCNQKILFNK